MCLCRNTALHAIAKITTRNAAVWCTLFSSTAWHTLSPCFTMGGTSPTAVSLLVRGSELARKSMIFLGQSAPKCTISHQISQQFSGEGTHFPEPTPSPPTAPRLRAFGETLTPSALKSQRLRRLVPHPRPGLGNSKCGNPRNGEWRWL